MIAAYLFHEAGDGWGLPTALAAVVVIVLTGLIALLFHAVVLRPMRHAAPLNRVVAALGLLIVLQAAVVLAFGGQSRSVPSFLPQSVVGVFGKPVGVHVFVRLGVVLVLAAALWAFFRYTTAGAVTTAVAEGPAAAATLGWSADAVAGACWFGGGVLAGVTGVLLAPLQNPLSSTSLVLLVVPALAVALAAGFRSFPLVVVGGLLLALVELQLQVHLTGPHDWAQGLDSALPVLVIIVLLVARGAGIPDRAHQAEDRPPVGSGAINLPVLVGGFALLLALVWLVLPDSWVSAVAIQSGYALILLSLVVLAGYAGQLSLAQSALAGIAALIAGRLWWRPRAGRSPPRCSSACWPPLPSACCSLCRRCAPGACSSPSSPWVSVSPSARSCSSAAIPHPPPAARPRRSSGMCSPSRAPSWPPPTRRCTSSASP